MQAWPLAQHWLGSHSASVMHVPGPPGVPVVPQQTRPLSHGACVPVVQVQPSPVHGGTSSHWPPLLQKLEQQLGHASPQLQLASQAAPSLAHPFG